MPHLFANGGRKNLCVRMPTSAGKTKIAELAILTLAAASGVDPETVLSTLDGLLISMTEECEAEEITPDTFQNLLCRSLVHLQLSTDGKRPTVNRMLAARVRFIRNRHPDAGKRRQFYQLGLPLRDCEFIEEERAMLLALYQRATDYGTWTITERAAHLDDISGVLFSAVRSGPRRRSAGLRTAHPRTVARG